MIIGKRSPHNLEEGETSFIAGSRTSVELETLYHKYGLMCRLEVTHSNKTDAVMNDPKLLSLMTSIQITANGSEHFKMLKPDKMFFNELKNFGALYDQDIKTNIADNLKSYVTFFIPFAMLQMIRAEDTILDCNNFKSLNLFVNWGGSETIGQNIEVSSAKLFVSSVGTIGHIPQAGEPIKYYVENTDEKEVTSSTNNFSMDLNKDKFYKGFAITSKVDGKFNDEVIKKIRLVSGARTFWEWNAKTVRSENARDFKIINKDDLKGIYYLDNTIRGKMSDMIPTNGTYKNLKLVFEVAKGAGTTTIEVNTDEVEFTNNIPNKG